MRPSARRTSCRPLRRARRRRPERAHAAVARKDGAVHALEEADDAARAVAARPFALAARAAADGELLDQHRIAQLQDLRIGEARVGHVHVHGGGAVEAGPAPAPPEHSVS